MRYLLTLALLLVAAPAFAQMGVDTPFTVNGTSTAIFAANSQRGHIFCQNTGTTTINCGFGTVNTCTSNNREVVPGAYFEYSYPIVPKQDLCCISSNGTGEVDCYQGVTNPPQ